MGASELKVMALWGALFLLFSTGVLAEEGGKAGSADPYVVVCPRQMVRTTSGSQIKENYLPAVTNPSQWKSVLRRTDSLKFYISAMTSDKLHKDSNEYRRKLAKLIKNTGLEVCIEVGGSRIGGGTPKLGDKAGEFSAKRDQKQLQKWLDAPGARLDAIVTDHSMMWYIREQTEKDIPLLIQEYIDYVVEMKKWRPGLKVGIIESLGYFKVVREGKTYRQTSKKLPPLEFRSFLTQVLAEAKKNKVTIDFFDVDFGVLTITAKHGTMQIVLCFLQ